MGFKLGASRGAGMSGGRINNGMRVSPNAGDPDASVPGTPVIRTKLEKGVLGEANADGSIYISEDIQPGSFQERQTLKHEMIHAKDMRISPNKLSYTDNSIIYDGDVYARQQKNGKDMIFFQGQWVESGTMDFPWEQDANKIYG
jgi:urease alpha subunit